MDQNLTGYSALHKRLTRQRGRAADHECVRCPARAAEWAQVHLTDGEDIWADYVPMCIYCHRQYDRVNRTPKWAERSQRMAELNRSRRGVPLAPEHRAKVVQTLQHKGHPVGCRCLWHGRGRKT